MPDQPKTPARSVRVGVPLWEVTRPGDTPRGVLTGVCTPVTVPLMVTTKSTPLTLTPRKVTAVVRKATGIAVSSMDMDGRYVRTMILDVANDQADAAGSAAADALVAAGYDVTRTVDVLAVRLPADA